MPAPTRSSILAIRILTLATKIISGIAIAKPLAVVISAKLDVTGQSGRFDRFGGRQSLEGTHHSEDGSKQTDHRSTLDDRADPAEPVLQIAHHVTLVTIHHDLTGALVTEFTMSDGQFDHLRNRPRVAIAILQGPSKSPAFNICSTSSRKASCSASFLNRF